MNYAIIFVPHMCSTGNWKSYLDRAWDRQVAGAGETQKEGVGFIMSRWFQKLMQEIETEANRLAEMDGTMEEKERELIEVSLPRVMKCMEEMETME